MNIDITDKIVYVPECPVCSEPLYNGFDLAKGGAREPRRHAGCSPDLRPRDDFERKGNKR